MSGPSKPVFLSYASQDAEAALRITEALRAAGLEAWFDQSELRGGDAWDQKIRRQIKECAIFMPLISANTESRIEGYFRLEWKLAVDRSHLMADDAPFLVPVAIDDTRDADARVPDRFRDVQWMRLGRDSPEAIAARVARLVSGEAKSASAMPRAAAFRLRKGYVWAAIGVAIGIATGLAAILRPAILPKAEKPATAEVSAPRAEATRLARGAIDGVRRVRYTREHLAIATESARKATELDPSLALAWGARALVEATWINRFWDTSEERRRSAQDLARRALALDADEPHALWAQGIVLNAQNLVPEAAAVLERAVRKAPDGNFAMGSLAVVYRRLGRPDEANALNQEAMRRNPRDPLPHYALAISTVNNNGVKDNDLKNVDIALAHLDRAIEIEPFVSAITWKAAFLAGYKGDTKAAMAMLERLKSFPHEEAADDRTIFMRMWVALLDGQAERTLEAAGAATSPYFGDAVAWQPVAWMKALAHKRAGRVSAAAEEWRAAEKVLRERLAANPDTLRLQAELATTLAMQGRKAEAEKQAARFEASMRDQGRSSITLVRYYAAMGDAKRTAAAAMPLRKTTALWTTDAVLARDPWFDAVRTKAEFKALVER